MADVSSLFLTRRNDGRRFKFRSTGDLCSFLGISTPYCKCIAYAPYARNAPYCSRPINREHRAKVPGLISHLVDVRIPSTRAGRLLEELSSCVVCGVTGWHQNKTDEVYREWCDDLWGEYLRVNNLNPRLSISVPQQLNRHTWESALQVARAEQQRDREESNVIQNGDDQDNPERSRTLDLSNFVSSESAPGPDTPSRNHGNTEWPNISPEAPRNTQRPSEPAFLVHRDSTTESPPQSSPSSNERVNFSAMSYRPPLSRLDQNIPVLSASASRNTSVSSGNRYSEAGRSSSDPSRPRFGERDAVPHNTADCPEEGEGSNVSQSTSITHGRDEPASSEAISRSHSLVVVTNSQVIPEDSSQGARQETLEENREESPEDNNEDIEEESHTSSHGLHQGQPNLQGNSQESSQDSRQEDEVASTTAEAHSDNQLSHSSSNENAETELDFSSELLHLGEVFDNNNISTETPDNFFPGRSIAIARSGFRLYSQAQPLALFKTLYNRIRQTVTTSRNCAGYIYAFRRPALPGFLKIGHVRGGIVPDRPYPHPVDNRLAIWMADCRHPVEEVFRVPIAYAVERIEGLTHMTLQEYRRVEDPPCARCKRS